MHCMQRFALMSEAQHIGKYKYNLIFIADKSQYELNNYLHAIVRE